jgi:Zn-dependent peptidase ImmA (M78 family)
MSKKLTAEAVLKACGITRRPVPLDRILEHYSIQKVRLEASADIFGAIVRRGKKVSIAVNPSQHPNRQRFTLAHELGHYFCHNADDMEYVDGDFRISWRNNASSAGVDWKEIEANRFAAELLMPERLLRKDVDKHSVINRDVVQLLASLYGVSRLAMQFRLINLGLLPPEADPSDDSM